MPEKCLLGLTSARKAGGGPAPRFLTQRTPGPLAAAGVAGLRGIFPDRNGMLHTVFCADGRHRCSLNASRRIVMRVTVQGESHVARRIRVKAADS
jgi:hypothetical protein